MLVIATRTTVGLLVPLKNTLHLPAYLSSVSRLVMVAVAFSSHCVIEIFERVPAASGRVQVLIRNLRSREYDIYPSMKIKVFLSLDEENVKAFSSPLH